MESSLVTEPKIVCIYELTPAQNCQWVSFREEFISEIKQEHKNFGKRSLLTK